MAPLMLFIGGGIAVAIWLIVTDRDRTPRQRMEDVALAVLIGVDAADAAAGALEDEA